MDAELATSLVWLVIVVVVIGAKTCAYCGSAIEPYNIRVWAFHKVEEG